MNSSTFYSGSTNETSDSFFDWDFHALDFGSAADFNQDYQASDLPKAKQICSPSEEIFSFEEFQAEETNISSSDSANSNTNTVLSSSRNIQKKTTNSKKSPSESLRKRNPWTSSEDEQLLYYLEIYGNQWAKIASHIPNRKGKQVRDRYMSALASNINRNPWTEEEDTTILRMLEEMGPQPQWCRIAEALDGRTDIQVKNRYHLNLKKQEGKLSIENKPNIILKIAEEIPLKEFETTYMISYSDELPNVKNIKSILFDWEKLAFDLKKHVNPIY